MQVGRRLLRHCVFVHLSDDDAKFALLLEMLHKLYALANLQCCEDNPDGLTYHEILLPGQLLAKFFKEQVETALAEFAEHVRPPLHPHVMGCPQPEMHERLLLGKFAIFRGLSGRQNVCRSSGTAPRAPRR